MPSRDLLPTLLVFQGAAVTHENFSQSPPGNVAALRGSLPLQRFQEQLDWPSSAGPPLQGTEIAALSIPEAIHLSLIALLPGVLQRVCRTGKRSPFCPGQVCSDLISLLDGSLWRFPSGGISSLRRRVQSVTPARSGGSYGRDPQGGTSRSFWSLNRGCWDNPPTQSSLYKETVCLEVEACTYWCGDCQLDPVNCPVGLDPLSLGIKAHSPEFGIRDAVPAYFSHSWLPFLMP